MRKIQIAGIVISILLLAFGATDVIMQFINDDIVRWRVPLFLIIGGSMSALGLFFFLEPPEIGSNPEYNESDFSKEYGDTPGLLSDFAGASGGSSEHYDSDTSGGGSND